MMKPSDKNYFDLSGDEKKRIIQKAAEDGVATPKEMLLREDGTNPTHTREDSARGLRWTATIGAPIMERDYYHHLPVIKKRKYRSVHQDLVVKVEELESHIRSLGQILVMAVIILLILMIISR